MLMRVRYDGDALKLARSRDGNLRRKRELNPKGKNQIDRS